MYYLDRYLSLVGTQHKQNGKYLQGVRSYYLGLGGPQAWGGYMIDDPGPLFVY